MNFENHSPLSKLFEKARQPLADCLESIAIEKDQIVKFRRLGSPGFYSVAKGHHTLELVRDKKRSIVRICGPGDLVGFGNWITPNSNVHYQLRALEIGELHFMPKTKYEQLSLEVSELNALVINSLCRIIALKDERISALENHSVKARISALLLSLGKKFGTDTPQGRFIDLAVDRSSLATLAGTSVESLARVITELENDGIVERKRRKLILRNEQRLAKALDT